MALQFQDDDVLARLRDLQGRRDRGEISGRQFDRTFKQMNRRTGRRCARLLCREIAMVTPDNGQPICARHYLASRTPRMRRPIAYWLSWLLVGVIALAIGAPLTAFAHWLSGGLPIRSILIGWGALILIIVAASAAQTWRRRVGLLLALLLAVGLTLIYVAHIH